MGSCCATIPADTTVAPDGSAAVAPTDVTVDRATQIQNAVLTLKCLTERPCEYLARTSGHDLNNVVYQQKKEIAPDVFAAAYVVRLAPTEYLYKSVKYQLYRITDDAGGSEDVVNIKLKLRDEREAKFTSLSDDPDAIYLCLSNMGYV
jgi:hypothetical protein